MNDELLLDRFLKAQEEAYPRALEEIRSGGKRSHWVWYIFPQLKALGHSDMAQYYGIRDLEEAREYWSHPVLSARLVEISQALLEQPGTARDLMGSPDDLKLRSSMTLFYQISGHPVFRQVIDRFYDGEFDVYMVGLLEGDFQALAVQSSRKGNHMKIIVMGGSFNPPTLAHGRLLSSAVEQLHADLGLFIPSDHNYVKRKMKHTDHPQEIFTEAMRFQMLEMMAEDREKLAVSDLEYNRTEKGRSFETMEAVQRLYPEAELYFLVGADKLEVIPRWHRVEDFLGRFRIAAVSRDGDTPEKAIRENPLLSRYADSFSVIQAPMGMEAVSSTAVRDLLREGDPAAETMVHPGVWELLVSRGYVTDRAITRFREDYMFLSNFYEAPLTYEGIPYLSSEAAFQAQKCVTEEERRAFSDLRTGDAKRMGRQVPLRPDWEEVKRDAMEGIVRAKFTQNPELAGMLLDTGNRVLLEGNTWHDTYWGIDLKTHEGENHLGRILMKIRQELREKA